MTDNKTTCQNCRFFIPIGDTWGYCGNSRTNKTTTTARKACEQYDSRTATGGGTPQSR